MNTNNQTWIIGCGDIGKRLAKLYGNTTVNGVVSSDTSSTDNAIPNLQLSIINLDVDYIDNKSDFINADIFYFAPPPPTGNSDTRLKRFLQQLGNVSPRRIVLISTTGVYGDSAGEWIDENTPLNPKADRAVRRVSAEAELQAWAKRSHCEIMILRVPGIYAKDRLPIARLQKGLPIVNENEAGFTNRIHADDLASICKVAMELTSVKNEIFNVTDGNPSTMTAYFNQVADYANLPRPPQISLQEAEQTLSDGMVSYLKESRRIRNDKMLAILGIKLQYPDLQSALQK